MAGRSFVLVMALAFGVLGSLLYVSTVQSSGRIAHDPNVIPTEPKISQTRALETAEEHLRSKVQGAEDVRLEVTLYNFSIQRYGTDPEYTQYVDNHLRRGWPLSQVKEHPELLNLGLYFVHANGTLLSVNATTHTFEKICEKPSIQCPLPKIATNASKDRLVYKVTLTWLKPFIPINEGPYLVDAETGEMV